MRLLCRYQERQPCDKHPYFEHSIGNIQFISVGLSRGLSKNTPRTGHGLSVIGFNILHTYVKILQANNMHLHVFSPNGSRQNMLTLQLDVSPLPYTTRGKTFPFASFPVKAMLSAYVRSRHWRPHLDDLFVFVVKMQPWDRANIDLDC